jgi:hypothetical protein
VSPYKRFLALCASLLVALTVGCAGSRPGRVTVASAKSAAPDDVGMHGNQNAPYMLPGSTPRLVSRATETDAKDARPCSPDILSADEIAGSANGNVRSVKLAFMNRGAMPCTVGGYPGVSLLDSSGERIGSVTVDRVTEEKVVAELSPAQAASAAAATPSITLMPHQVAAFQVVWTSGSDCSRVSRIVVTAPGSQERFSITQPMSICAGRIQITQLRLDEGNI